ncbi:MAG: hypothetical protein ACOY0T_39260 [Myxococcota bacterium]
MNQNPYLALGLDGDVVAWAALGVSGVATAIAFSPRVVSALRERSPAWALLALAAAAWLLSLGYLHYYLRGGPRIIDAAHYYLAGRALSEGYFAFPVPEPLASFSGRFLATAPSGDALAVLFPPGYPAALALAFEVGAPLALGPALAAALVLATYWLARQVGASSAVARAAALLSVLSVALRYHTADTMSHGLAALLLAGATAASLVKDRAYGLLAGVLCGWLIATRPVTGMVAVLGLAFVQRAATLRLLLFALGLAPGIALLLLQQKAVTGDYFASTQLAYYARADGPPGCFRYGFGKSIGCLFEHGDYVRARLPHGYGLREALATTWRRLLVHTLDIANFAPLALGIPLAAWFGRRERTTRLLVALVVAGMLAYAPFYFEGSFPGGGARFFGDWLPLEHVLVARALAELGATRFAWPLVLAGFALHTSTQHRSLRDREGGRPMFEPAELARHGVTRGLMFVETDHGFALAFDPAVKTASDGVVVARARHDALDALLWQALGKPPTYCYDYDPGARQSRPTIRACTPAEDVTNAPRENVTNAPREDATNAPREDATNAPREDATNAPREGIARIEGESLWPPFEVKGGWAHPDYLAQRCISRGRGLRVRAEAERARLGLTLPPIDRPTDLRVGWSSDAPPSIEVSWGVRHGGTGSAEESLPSPRNEGAARADARPIEGATLTWRSSESGCWQSAWITLSAESDVSRLRISAANGVLDYIELRPSRPESR